MKKLSWFLVLAIMAFACETQNEDIYSSRNLTGAPVPGEYGIVATSTDGFAFTITIDQSVAQDISHLLFKFYDCEGGDLDITNITSATINDVDWMSELSAITGGGDPCDGFFDDPFVKLDNLDFQSGTVEIVITLDTKSSGGMFLIKSAGGCFGNENEDYSFFYDCAEEPCYEYREETAWANGPRYVARGNWATYTPYTDEEITVNIYAGQHMLAGTAHFSAMDNDSVTLTITLEDGWSLLEGESIKIMNYYGSVGPTGNPSPGRFSFKYNTLDPISLPDADFYGIHLDIQKAFEVPCQ